MSIRLKPSSPLFKVIPELYQELRHYEKDHGMDKTIDLLTQKLKTLGFNSYEEFMYEVLNAELANFCQHTKSDNEFEGFFTTSRILK